MFVVRKGAEPRNIERIQHEMEDVFHALSRRGARSGAHRERGDTGLASTRRGV